MVRIISNAYSGRVIENLLLRRPLSRQREREQVHEGIETMDVETSNAPSVAQTQGEVASAVATQPMNQQQVAASSQTSASNANAVNVSADPIIHAQGSQTGGPSEPSETEAAGNGDAVGGESADQTTGGEEAAPATNPNHGEQVDSTLMVKNWVRFLRGVDILDGYISHLNFNRVRRGHGAWPQVWYFDLQVGITSAFLVARENKIRSSSEPVEVVMRKYTKLEFTTQLIQKIMRFIPGPGNA